MTEPHEIVLVLDENISGLSIVQALAEAGLLVRAFTDVLPRGSSDIKLLRHLSRRGWFLLTRDRDFRYKPQVRKTLYRGNVGVFVITVRQYMTGIQFTELIAKAWPKIQRFVEKNRVPFVAKITRDGRVTKC